MSMSQSSNPLTDSLETVNCTAGGRKRSLAWDHFIPIEGTNPPRAECIHCKKSYVASNASGVTNLRNHIVLKRCKVLRSKATENDEKQQTLKIETKTSSDESKSKDLVLSGGFDKNVARKECARMIITDELPFSHVENSGFRRFSTYLNPRFEPPSRRTITRDVMDLYLQEKANLKIFLKENAPRVCLTTDCWTSIQNCNYMVITAHFIDNDWKLHKKILNFCEIPDHKGETIGKIIESSLHDWDIKSVFTITVDNATANDTALKYIKRRLENTNRIVLEGQYLHLRCCAHILNLIVGEGLKEKCASIQAIRNAIRYVRSSPSRLQKFQTQARLAQIECQSHLLLDVPTRWNSTYLMLQCALKFKVAFDRLAEEDGHYISYFMENDDGKKRVGPPILEDWENAMTLVEFLRTFYDMTLKFSISLDVTSHRYFHEVWELMYDLKQKSENGGLLLSKMAIEMKKKFDKYWGTIESINPLLLIAVVLDPGYKLDYLGFSFGDMYDEFEVEIMTKKVKRILESLYGWYSALSSRDGSSVVESHSRSEISVESERVPSKDRWRHKILKKGKIEITSSEKHNEIEMYLMEAVVDSDDTHFDLLCWWRGNSKRFPILALIARDVFAIPISTVASESAFSTGNRILDPFRSSLTPRMVESLVCAQNWLRTNKVFMQSGEIVEEMTLYEVLDSEIYGPKVSVDSLMTIIE